MVQIIFIFISTLELQGTGDSLRPKIFTRRVTDINAIVFNSDVRLWDPPS